MTERMVWRSTKEYKLFGFTVFSTVEDSTRSDWEQYQSVVEATPPSYEYFEQEFLKKKGDNNAK